MDLVVITVKVPMHGPLVRAAVAAGKHVLCEWPLGRTTEEAAALASAARDAGVVAVTGLQTRYAPAVAYARQLIADGYLGTVTSATLLSTRAKGGDGRVPAWTRYTFDQAMGAGSLEVMGGHALDAIEYLLGRFTRVSAMLAIQHPCLSVAETDETIEVTSPDHIAVHGVLTTPGPRTVSRLYQHLYHQLRTGSGGTPSFADGVRTHQLLDAIRRSAKTGTQQSPAPSRSA